MTLNMYKLLHVMNIFYLSIYKLKFYYVFIILYMYESITYKIEILFEVLDLDESINM